jgi:uncharacterized protein (DUF302 family)
MPFVRLTLEPVLATEKGKIQNFYAGRFEAIGFLALFGVSVQTGVIMLEYINQLRARGYKIVDAAYLTSIEQLREAVGTRALPESMEVAMVATVNKGIVDKPSNHSVEQTVDRLKNILQSKGVTLFAVIDHSGEADKVGMKMRPTKLLIFGNPKAGTPLMLAAPSVAIDLPLKILVWEDGQRKVWLSYNSSEYLKERHGLPQDLLANMAVTETLAAKAAE